VNLASTGSSCCAQSLLRSAFEPSLAFVWVLWSMSLPSQNPEAPIRFSESPVPVVH
jgi:hypothetical protein